MTWYGVLGHKDPIGDLKSRTKVCSEHLEDNDVKFVGSWTRTLKDGTHPLLFLWSTRGHMYFKDEFFIVFSKIIVGMDVSSEKKSGKNKLLQGLWKVREFHFEFGEIYIFEKSLEKVKFQVKWICSSYLGPLDDERWRHFPFWYWLICTLFWTVDRFLSNTSFSYVMPVEVGLGMQSCILFFFNLQGVKLIFFSDSHLATKFFKVVANAKKSWSPF